MQQCGWPTFLSRHNCLISFFIISFCIWAFFFLKNITVFFPFSKGAKQTSLQSETSLIFLFPQETCFPSFHNPVLASPCCWASRSCVSIKWGQGLGGAIYNLRVFGSSFGFTVLQFPPLSKMPASREKGELHEFDLDAVV